MEIKFLPKAEKDSISDGMIYVYVLSLRYHYSK